MKTLAASAALAATIPAGPALADDWSGFYAGISGGYAFGDVDAGALNLGFGKKGKKIPVDELEMLQPEGGFGEVSVGYRQQSGDYIYGGEIGIGFGDVSDAIFTLGADPDLTLGTSVFARAQAGQIVGDYYLFGSFGIASTEVSSDEYDFDQDRAIGYSIGVGAERMLTDQISLSAEIYRTLYPEYELLLDAADGTTFETSFGVTSVQIGANFRF